VRPHELSGVVAESRQSLGEEKEKNRTFCSKTNEKEKFLQAVAVFPQPGAGKTNLTMFGTGGGLWAT